MSHCYNKKPKRQYVALNIYDNMSHYRTKGEPMTERILRPPTPKEIKDLRLDLKLSTEEAGNLLHISNRTFQRYERGNTPMPLAYWELFALKCKVLKSRQGKMS